LSLAFGDRWTGRRIVDLGCLEGGYTTEFARLGFEALGIEVRQSNFINCEYVRNSFNLPNLSFARDDVWNIERYGGFDAVFCCGLFYHLDRPREFLRLASSQCKKIILIQTHFSTVLPIDRFDLSPMTMNEGMPGRWYREAGVTPTESDEGDKWGSWDNRKSFWIQREYLIDEIHQNGFDMVFEQYDCLDSPISLSMTEGYYRTDNRCMFVGIRTEV